METNFDAYVNDYRDIINKVSKISGEEYEHFVNLRISLMKAQLKKNQAPPASFTLQSILDFGCGAGATEMAMKENFPGSRIYGLDTSRESIAAAKKLALGDVTFMSCSKTQFPLDNNSVDLIYSNGTFHHMDYSKHSIMLQELKRVLKEDGQIFIFENNPYNPLMMRAMKNNPFDKDAKVVHPNYLKVKLAKAGFRLNTTQYYFFFPRFLKILRPIEQHLRFLPVGAQYFVSASK
jgi:ubiquinone/menaquinone biosynthesis C-methylase UbiE